MKLLPRILWTVTIVYWISLFILMHIPQQRIPRMPVTDKTAHLVAYFVLGCLIGASMWAQNPSSKYIGLWVILIGMAYGAFDELTQDLVGRYCEWNDWLADSIGTCAAVLVIGLLRMLRKPRTMPEPGGFSPNAPSKTGG